MKYAMDRGLESVKGQGLFSNCLAEGVWRDLSRWIRSGRSGLDRGRKRRGAAGGGRDCGGAMAREVGFGESDHHTSREKDGEQEGDSANSMEGSRAAATAWRRA